MKAAPADAWRGDEQHEGQRDDELDQGDPRRRLEVGARSAARAPRHCREGRRGAARTDKQRRRRDDDDDLARGAAFGVPDRRRDARLLLVGQHPTSSPTRRRRRTTAAADPPPPLTHRLRTTRLLDQPPPHAPPAGAGTAIQRPRRVGGDVAPASAHQADDDEQARGRRAAPRPGRSPALRRCGWGRGAAIPPRRRSGSTGRRRPRR